MGTVLRLDLFRDRVLRDWVQGLNSASPVILPAIVKGDTLEIAITNLERNPALPASPVYVVEPWVFTSVRASLGLVGLGPTRGTFKLRVNGQTTNAITWPSDLSSAALITAWKAAVLAELVALSNISPGDVRVDDPVGAPAHELYFTWLNPAWTYAIEVLENTLTPAVAATVQPLQDAPAFTQVVRFVQLPLALTDDFEFIAAPVPTITDNQPQGAAGVNEVQILNVPSAASGAFALTWATFTTRPLNVVGLTASAIQSALNEIVVDGDSNPSFRVSIRTRGKYAIEFIGPLAGAAQPAIGVDPRSEPNYTATALLPATAAKFDRALNGAPSVKLKLAVTIVDAEGEMTIQREITLLAPLTTESTVQAIEEADAVLVRTEVVIVDNSTLDPIATVAAGFSHTPAVAAASFVVTHNLNSWQVAPRVLFRIQDAPEKWRELQLGGDYEAENTTVNQTTFTFPDALVTSPSSSDLYTGRYKLFVTAPDATVTLLAHDHTWAQCRETLPAGQTVAAKFAAIDAALGLVDGAAPIDAARIVGLLSPDQINVTALSTVFRTNSEFLKTLRELVKDGILVDNLAEALAGSEKFITTLNGLWLNATVLDALIDALGEDAGFEAKIVTIVNAALAGGAGLPLDAVPLVVSPFSFVWPTPVEISWGDAAVPNLILYPPLPTAVLNATDGGNIAGELAAGTILAATRYTTNGAAYSRDVEARRGEDFAIGDIVANPQGFWFRLTGSSNDFYPAEMELLLAAMALNSKMLRVGTQLVATLPVQAALRGGAFGQAVLIIEQGVPAAEATAPANLQTMTWTSRFEQTIRLCDLLASHTMRLTVVRPVGGGALTATLRMYGFDNVLSPANDPESAWRLRFGNFDVTNSAALQRGSLLVQMLHPLAAVVPV